MRRFIAAINHIVMTFSLSAIALLLSLFDKDGRINHRMSKFWARNHLKVCGIKPILTGVEKIPSPPYIFLCNHQSALDIYTLLAVIPYPFRWVAKQELFKIPVFGWALKRGGNISVDRDNPREALKAMEEAGERIRGGVNIVMFPEGTRNTDGTLLPFKKGSFSLAAKAKVPVVPVGIRETNILQPVGNFIPKKPGLVYIHIGDPIQMEDGSTRTKERVMQEVRSRIEELMACQET